MTTYNTQNPLGSADPRDLYDNAENADRLINGTENSYPDRLGNARLSWAGIESRFADFLANSGYQFLGDYAAGIEITEYNQVVRDVSGEFWRLSGSTALPYTTTGAGLPEGGAFVAVGDAALRQELALPVSGGNGALHVSGAVIYVDTIADLQALPTRELVDGQQSVVQGGVFQWSSSESAWHPIKWVNVKALGAIGDGVADDTAALVEAFSLSNAGVYLPPGTYLVNQLICTGDTLEIVGSAAAISYQQDIDGNSITLINSSVSGVTFDGNEVNIGDGATSNYTCAPLLMLGSYARVENCTFKNLHGKQDSYQYGLIIDPSCSAVVEQCLFENIKTRTNTAATGGFCGGIYFYNNDAPAMRAASQRVNGCFFVDIYTTRNSTGDQFWDSDGVRNYYAIYGTGNAAYDDSVDNSVITVSNCTFLNVLKSACKLNRCTVLIDNCSVDVTDMKDQGQTHSYTGFRYQVGNKVTIRNSIVRGKNRAGALVAGTHTTVDGCTFEMQNVQPETTSSGMWLGSINSPVRFCSVSNTSVVGADYSFQVYGSEYTVVENCDLEGLISAAKANSITVSSSRLNQMISNSNLSSYTPAIERVTFLGCDIDFSTQGAYCNHITTNTPFTFIVDNCSVINSPAALLETTTNCDMVVRASSFSIASTDTTRRFLNKSSDGRLVVRDTKVEDLRAPSADLLVFVDSPGVFVDIDGLELTVSPTGSYTHGIYLSSAGNNARISNSRFTDLPSGSMAIRLITTQGASISNVRLDYAEAVININNSNAAVNFLHGTLAATHIVLVSGGTVQEFATAKF